MVCSAHFKPDHRQSAFGLTLGVWPPMLKEKKTQSKCMFRLGDDDIESPYKKFLDTFDFFV